MNKERQTLNRNLAQMLKGGVIMDVTTPEQAKIAEAAGACAVMALGEGTGTLSVILCAYTRLACSPQPF